MGKYKYIAINQSGEKVNGTLSAANLIDVEEFLRKQNLIIVSIQEDITNKLNSLMNKELTGIPFKDKLSILTQIYTMIASGVNVNRAFEILISQKWKNSINEKLKRI